MVDALFAEPRLAEVYDPLDADRSDLDVCAALVDELGARSVLDVGCGTGTFACLLAERGKEVTGVDPAAASLAVARGKPGADRVRWLAGDASTLPPLNVDLVTMTGNVAQVFLADEDWASTLRGARSALRPGGWLVFEIRDPARRAWREWQRDQTHRRVELPEVGPVETWIDLTDVSLPFVSFRTTFVFGADGAVLTSDSTLRFRSRDEVGDSLDAGGFVVHEVRDAPDRPGRELVFIARRRDEPDAEPAGDVVTVERDLAAYYEQEAAERAGRALDPRRVAARAAFLARLGGRTGRLLEVGIGPGRDAAAFVAGGVRVVGVDLSVEHARRARSAGAAAAVATVRCLPFDDGTFSALWSMSTLMHVPNEAIADALAELRRVLAPGALAAIGGWGGPDVEHRSDIDVLAPPRFFSRRSDDRWRSLLATLGSIEEFATWGRDGNGFWYQWAVVRRT